MLYQYKAYKADRVVTSGTVEAVSEKMAEEILYQAGFKYVLNLKSQPAPKTISQLIPTLFGVKNRDIIDFSRQLASFLESGSSLMVALELLKDQDAKPALKTVIDTLISRLKQGVPFSQVIKENPEVFSFSYYQVISSCEKTGDMVKGLNQIADYMEQKAVTADKIKRALVYPIFTIGLAIVVVIFMVTTVLPPIIKLFESFDADLPPMTVFALGLIDFVMNNNILILIVLIAIVAGIWLLLRFPAGKVLMDKWLLKVPVFGAITLQSSLGQFCRTASMLMTAGLSLPSIMDVSIKSTSRNLVIQKSFSKLRTRLMQGEGLTLPISQDKLFPPMMVKMISVGEKTGTLDNALETLARYYEDRANRRIQSLVAMIEPVMTVVIGLVVIFIMLSMILPIMTIINQVK